MKIGNWLSKRVLRGPELVEYILIKPLEGELQEKRRVLAGEIPGNLSSSNNDNMEGKAHPRSEKANSCAKARTSPKQKSSRTRKISLSSTKTKRSITIVNHELSMTNT
jgi:hypothetical protein